MNPGAPIRGRRYRAPGEDWTVGSLSDHHEESRGAGTGSEANKASVPFWHSRTSSNIDAGEFKHQLAN